MHHVVAVQRVVCVTVGTKIWGLTGQADELLVLLTLEFGCLNYLGDPVGSFGFYLGLCLLSEGIEPGSVCPSRDTFTTIAELCTNSCIDVLSGR
jgi:hypothetical protein